MVVDIDKVRTKINMEWAVNMAKILNMDLVMVKIPWQFQHTPAAWVMETATVMVV